MVTLEVIAILLSGISISASLFYYTTVLKNQNETRQAQLFSQTWSVFHENYSQYLNIVENWKFENYDEFTEKYGRKNNPEGYSDWLKLVNLLEGTGVLVKRGLAGKQLVGDYMAGFMVRYWRIYEPWITEVRSRYDWPSASEHIEYLYTEMEKIYRQKQSVSQKPNR